MAYLERFDHILEARGELTLYLVLLQVFDEQLRHDLVFLKHHYCDFIFQGGIPVRLLAIVQITLVELVLLLEVCRRPRCVNLVQIVRAHVKSVEQVCIGISNKFFIGIEFSIDRYLYEEIGAFV